MNLKKIFKSLVQTRAGIAIVAFIAGGLVTAFILPEKITIKRDKEIVEVEKIVEKEVVRYVDKIVEREVEKIVKVKTVKTKITYPDGKIVETEVYESETEQIDRMRELEKERYEEQVATLEKEYREKESYLKEHLNPKRISVYAGAMLGPKDQFRPYYMGGFTYAVWGPMIVGAQANSRADFGVTIGLRF